MKTRTVLVVEDDLYIRKEICDRLRDREIVAKEATTEAEALLILKEHGDELDAALLDMRVPPGSDGDPDSSKGRRSGMRLARFIRENRPGIRLIGTSFFDESEAREWFLNHGSGFLPKSWLVKGASDDFIDVVESVARKRRHKPKPKTFIVHGHDSPSLLELVNFVQNTLRWPAPKILRELPSRGKTIIEKFEEAAATVDVVFVLLTPDDIGAKADTPDEQKRRARQNVIFELGYFYAKLQRIGGRVVLLHKGQLELPSDIGGIIYIDISQGVKAEGEAIRQELSPWVR